MLIGALQIEISDEVGIVELLVRVKRGGREDSIGGDARIEPHVENVPFLVERLHKR